MSITVNLYYTGRDGSARKFAEEMVSSGTVDAIRAELDDLVGLAPVKEYVFGLADNLQVQQRRAAAGFKSAIDVHHASPMMQTIAALRSKYDLHMRVERYVSDEGGVPEKDQKFIRK